jgi:hypothetical protein
LFLCRPVLKGRSHAAEAQKSFFQTFSLFRGITLLFAAILLASWKEIPNDKPHVTVNIGQEITDSVSVISLGSRGRFDVSHPANDQRKAGGWLLRFQSFVCGSEAISPAPDIMIGNLELTFAGPKKPYGGYPAFNTPDDYITAITNSGFDFLVTSNNHSMDTGEEGLQRTLKKVREAGLGSTGTFDSQRDRDSIRILSKNGISVAILNYTYGTNGAYPSAEHKYVLNVADSSLVKADVLKARSLNPDLVVVIYHWGVENVAKPIAKQDSMFHWAADHGADSVIGAHPHVVGPDEQIQNGIKRFSRFRICSVVAGKFYFESVLALHG